MKTVFDRDEVRYWAKVPIEVISVTDYTAIAATFHNLAGKLLEYMDEDRQNPGVFDGAPDWADSARVQWSCGNHKLGVFSDTYTRTLPKTKAREIAERKALDWSGVLSDKLLRDLPDLLESAILEAQKDGGK